MTKEKLKRILFQFERELEEARYDIDFSLLPLQDQLEERDKVFNTLVDTIHKLYTE